MRSFLIIAAAALALSACAGAYRDGRRPTHDHFGQAVTANAQTSAAAAENTTGSTDGARAAEAIEAYREGPGRPIAAPAASDVGGSAQ